MSDRTVYQSTEVKHADTNWLTAEQPAIQARMLELNADQQKQTEKAQSV